jgi:hypothetical protein
MPYNENENKNPVLGHKYEFRASLWDRTSLVINSLCTKLLVWHHIEIHHYTKRARRNLENLSLNFQHSTYNAPSTLGREQVP